MAEKGRAGHTVLKELREKHPGFMQFLLFFIVCNGVTEWSREVDDHQEYCRTAPLSGADRDPGDSGKTVGGKADFRICAGDSGNV